MIFQSTPSSRKVTRRIGENLLSIFISIHTFLAEGDIDCTKTENYLAEFQSTPSSRKVTLGRIKYENTPGGFQSTPSSRKVTTNDARHLLSKLFQSTPSSRKVTALATEKIHGEFISIHTFLAEGDNAITFAPPPTVGFQSTPSSRKVTKNTMNFFILMPNFNPHLPRGR